LKLGHAEKVWPLLKHSPDPSLRSYLIHRFATLGLDPQVLVQRFEEEKDVSARRALILALGEFGPSEPRALASGGAAAPLPNGRGSDLTRKLLDLYRTDPDPGIHAAAAWLLRQWGHGDKLKAIDTALAERDRAVARAAARLPEGGRLWYVNGQGQTMAIVPGADFWMGSPRTEAGREGGPDGQYERLHWRRVGRTFAIASHEVTVEQFLRCREQHDHKGDISPAPDCPVNKVSWFLAAEYCNWLSEREGIPPDQWCYERNAEGEYGRWMVIKRNCLSLTGYRLPTEAEWEYACRAGTRTAWHCGDTEDLLGKYAWHSANSRDAATAPVGSLKPNDFGLFDMHGNVMEWCQGRIWDYPFTGPGGPAEEAADDGRVGIFEYRVVRGGAFLTPARQVRSAQRFWPRPTERASHSGFRVVRTMP
jgi:hypothetical protein